MERRTFLGPERPRDGPEHLPLKLADDGLHPDLVHDQTVVVHAVGPPDGQPRVHVAVDLAEEVAAERVAEHGEGEDARRLLAQIPVALAAPRGLHDVEERRRQPLVAQQRLEELRCPPQRRVGLLRRQPVEVRGPAPRRVRRVAHLLADPAAHGCHGEQQLEERHGGGRGSGARRRRFAQHVAQLRALHGARLDAFDGVRGGRSSLMRLRALLVAGNNPPPCSGARGHRLLPAEDRGAPEAAAGRAAARRAPLSSALGDAPRPLVPPTRLPWADAGPPPRLRLDGRRSTWRRSRNTNSHHFLCGCDVLFEVRGRWSRTGWLDYPAKSRLAKSHKSRSWVFASRNPSLRRSVAPHVSSLSVAAPRRRRP